MVDRAKVDYRDATPFDQSKLQDLQTIKDAILHKQVGEDVRAPLAQLPDALVKLFQEDGTDKNAEIKEARGNFETLGLYETAQDSQIDKNATTAEKAQEQSINAVSIAQAAASGSPKETFADKSALEKKYPNGATGIYVTQDNGHWWYFSGVWQDGGSFQAAGIADKTVTSEKLSNEVKINALKSSGGKTSLSWNTGYIANKAKADKDGVTEGTLMTNSDFSTSQPIIVHPGDTIQAHVYGDALTSVISLWNSNGDYVESLADGIGAAWDTVVNVHKNGYVRISNYTNRMANGKVEVYRYPTFLGQTMSDEVSSSISWVDLPMLWVNNTYIGSSDNTSYPHKIGTSSKAGDNFQISKPFYVAAGTTVTVKAGIKIKACVLSEFKSDGTTFVKEYLKGDGSAGPHKILIDHDAYLRIGNDTNVEPNPKVSTYRAENIDSPLAGKTMNIIGDSYVDNNQKPIEDTWHYKIAQKYGMTYKNYGLHGNSLVRPNTNGVPVLDRLDEMDDGADYIVVVGGRNDYKFQYPIADFKAGIKSIIEKLQEEQPQAKLCLFTPWAAGSTEDQDIPIVDYAQAMQDECEAHSVPCFNSVKLSGITPWIADFRTKYMQTANDVSHLNSSGHDRFMPRAEAFLEAM